MDEKETQVAGPGDLITQILTQGRRGLTFNRFKGLGEMNDEQLWHTTLDPSTRTLLQVKIGDIEEAGQVFPLSWAMSLNHAVNLSSIMP